MNAPLQTTLGKLQVAQSSAGQVQSLPAVRAGFFDLQSFELMQRIAKGFASSTLVPQAYQGNIANCMIALNLAQRINGDPLMVMQNLIVVHGKPTWSAQYLIATANMCGRFSAIRFEFFGERNTDEWGCRAWAIETGTGEKLSGSDVTIGIAKKEGWYTKNGSKWQSIPQQMLMYRAGAWWVRAYAPELSMGLMTADEVRDTFDASRMEDGSFEVSIDDLAPSAPVNSAQEQGAVAAEASIEAEVAKATGKSKKQPESGSVDHQDDALRTLEKGSAPVFNFATVADKLNKAKDIDILDADADLIDEIADETQRNELKEIYRQRREELSK